jgi:hypothetical protein
MGCLCFCERGGRCLAKGEDMLGFVADLEVLVDSGMSPEHDAAYTRMIGSSLLSAAMRSTGRKEIDVVSSQVSCGAKASSSYRSSPHSAHRHAPASLSPRPSCPTQSRNYFFPTNMTIYTMLASQRAYKARITVPTTRNVLLRKIPISHVNQHLHVQHGVLLSADPVET